MSHGNKMEIANDTITYSLMKKILIVIITSRSSKKIKLVQIFKHGLIYFQCETYSAERHHGN